jgi:hypothetical protein
VTPTLSVEAVQARLIWVGPAAVAASPVGARGRVVSGASVLAEARAEKGLRFGTASAARTRNRYVVLAVSVVDENVAEVEVPTCAKPDRCGSSSPRWPSGRTAPTAAWCRDGRSVVAVTRPPAASPATPPQGRQRGRRRTRPSTRRCRELSRRSRSRNTASARATPSWWRRTTSGNRRRSR